jgi:hypothetical protein
MSVTLDRTQLCDAYLEQYPKDEFNHDIHHIVSDYNFEDGWLLKAIANSAIELRVCDADLRPWPSDAIEDMRRRLFFLVELLKAPMPLEWDEDDE